MKAASPTFHSLYRETYYGGSFFDGLKVGSTIQEFDLNIVFKWKARNLQVARLGEDPKKRNFCFLMVNRTQLSPAEEKMVEGEHLSPSRMYSLVRCSLQQLLLTS